MGALNAASAAPREATETRASARETKRARRVGLVLAGGGERVVAWETGVLAGLAEGGFDPRTAGHVIGTSAGSAVAARIAAGLDPHAEVARIAVESAPVPEQIRRVVADVVPRVIELVWERDSDTKESQRRRRAGFFARNVAAELPVQSHVTRHAAQLPDDDWPAALRLVAIDAETGERVVLDRSTGVSLREGVAAARALPGLVQPISIGARRLIDAGICSATNADLLPKTVDVAVIVTATPESPAVDSIECYWHAALARECASLRAAGIETVVIHASPAALDAMGDELMSTAGAAEAVEHGVRQGRHAASRLGRAPGAQRRR